MAKEVGMTIDLEKRLGEASAGGPRRPPLPGRALHPTVRHSLSKANDASALEAARDATLRFLARPFWAWLSLIHILLIVGDGAFFFFLLVNWQAMCVPDASGKCEPRNWWYNLSIQVLNALFTYGVALTMAWRLANAHHLCCSRRSCAPGRDLYGRPTDAIWFSVPVGHRRAIVALLLGNTFGQFANQATRIVYSDFASADGFPGNVWTNVFFGQNMLCAFAAAVYQAVQESRVRRADPQRFPPGPVEKLAALVRSRFSSVQVS